VITLESTNARELIYRNMDAMSLELDALDNLMQVQKGIAVYIHKIEKSISRGKEVNRLLESFTKHDQTT
jgi:hypothetical protein